jgi:predicted ATPase
MAAFHELMAGNWLLTLSGPGGTGKMRLALGLADQLQPGYPGDAPDRPGREFVFIARR